MQRQYTGTAGRIENAQVAVYLTYATTAGHAFIDRALYLPRCWVEDPARRAAAGVPDTVAFATKPALATQMLARALDAGVAASWVAGDEVYGADPGLRGELESRGIGYVLAIGCDRRVNTPAGTLRADAVAKALPTRVWQRLSAGRRAKGPRLYHWAWIEIDPEQPGHRWLLIRRNTTSGELAYYRCYAPHPAPLHALVTVAGRRWTVEENFQAAKGMTGLDQHQLRRWTSWQRWTILAMLAHAFLAVATAAQRDSAPTPAALIELTVNEFRRLFDALLLATQRTLPTLLTWSTWRRRHQARARQSHYRHREQQ